MINTCLPPDYSQTLFVAATLFAHAAIGAPGGSGVSFAVFAVSLLVVALGAHAAAGPGGDDAMEYNAPDGADVLEVDVPEVDAIEADAPEMEATDAPWRRKSPKPCSIPPRRRPCASLPICVGRPSILAG